MCSQLEGDVTVLHFPHRDLTAETARTIRDWATAAGEPVDGP